MLVSFELINVDFMLFPAVLQNVKINVFVRKTDECSFSFWAVMNVTITNSRSPIPLIQPDVLRYVYTALRLNDDKHQRVRDSSKKCTGQRGCNSNPVATLPHATVVFRMQPFRCVG